MGVSRCVRDYVSLLSALQKYWLMVPCVQQSQVGKRRYLQAVSLIVVEHGKHVGLILSSQNGPNHGTAEEDERI